MWSVAQSPCHKNDKLNSKTLTEVIEKSERQSRISAYNLHQAVYPLSLVVRRVGNSTNGWPKNFFHQRGLCKSKQTSHESRPEKSDSINSLTKRFLAALGNSSVREYVVDSGASYHIIGISLPVTKWSYQVTKAEEIPWAIAKAFYIARSGRPGPVLIDITKDAQFEMTEFLYKKHKKLRSYNPKPEISDNSITDACALINKAKKPFILFGQGVILANAEEELLAKRRRTPQEKIMPPNPPKCKI